MHKNKHDRTELDEGDIIELREGRVYATVPVHCVSKSGQSGRGVFDRFVRTDVDIKILDWLQGKYVVYKTTRETGSSESHDQHPVAGESGWHVFCEKMDKTKTRVDFYQSGGFTAIQYAIEPIGQAELTYQEKL